MPATLKVTCDLLIPEGSLTNVVHSGLSGNEIAAGKVYHVDEARTNFILAHTGTPVSRQENLFVARTAITILEIGALLVAQGSNTSIAFVLKANGSDVGGSTITLTHTSGNDTPVTVVPTTVDFAAGTRFRVDMAVTNNTGAQGPLYWVRYSQKAS